MSLAIQGTTEAIVKLALTCECPRPRRLPIRIAQAALKTLRDTLNRDQLVITYQCMKCSAVVSVYGRDLDAWG